MELEPWIKRVSIVWSLLFILGCIVIPLLCVMKQAWIGFSQVQILDAKIFFILKNSLYQALLSTLISGILGILLGLELGEVLILRPHSRVQALLLIPFIIPTGVVGITWIAWLGKGGVLSDLGITVNWLYSFKSIVLAHVFLNIPWITVCVAHARRFIAQEQLDAAYLMGAGFWKKTQGVIWPELKGVFLGSCLQVFTFCMMSFTIVIVLGGGPPQETLEVELYNRIRYQSLGFFGGISSVGVCAFWEVLVTLIPWSLYLIFVRRKNFWGKGSFLLKKSKKVLISWKEKIKWMVLSSISFGFVIPYLVIFNFKNSSIFLDTISPRFFYSLMYSFLTSLSIACLTSIGVIFTVFMVFMTLHATRRFYGIQLFLMLIFQLPTGISPLVLGFGFWLAYGQWLNFTETNGISFLVICTLQTALFSPIAFRRLYPLLKKIDKKQCESAFLLGASTLQVFFKTEFLKWKSSLISIVGILLGLSFGEVGVASFFYSKKWIPLSILGVHWIEQYRFFEAQAVSAFLFFISVLLVFISFEFGFRIFEYECS